MQITFVMLRDICLKIDLDLVNNNNKSPFHHAFSHSKSFHFLFPWCWFQTNFIQNNRGAIRAYNSKNASALATTGCQKGATFNQVNSGFFIGERLHYNQGRPHLRAGASLQLFWSSLGQHGSNYKMCLRGLSKWGLQC